MRNEASSGGQRPGPGRATGRVGKPARSLAQGRLWRSAPLRRPRPRGAGGDGAEPRPGPATVAREQPPLCVLGSRALPGGRLLQKSPPPRRHTWAFVTSCQRIQKIKFISRFQPARPFVQRDLFNR